MIVHRKPVGRTVRFGIGGALLSSVLFVSVSGFAGGGSSAPIPIASWGGICSASGNTSTGRQYAWIKESTRDPSICIRTKLGGEADNSVPDCWAARGIYGLTCVLIVDDN